MTNAHNMTPVPPPSHHKHIVDVLIEERARWLIRVPPLWFVLRKLLYPLLKYRDAIALADRIAPLGGAQIMDLMVDDLQLRLDITGLEHLPPEGRVVVVANHPTGIVDGIAVYQALVRKRRDLSFFANRDALRVAPRLREVLIPVEWVEDKRSVAKTRDMLKEARLAFEANHAVVIFPSGRLARMHRGRLREYPWLPTTINLARRHGASIVPLHIEARNSGLYYLFSRFSTELRNMTLFHELLNKRGETYRLRFGPLIPVEQLVGTPAEIAKNLKKYVENTLGGGPFCR